MIVLVDLLFSVICVLITPKFLCDTSIVISNSFISVIYFGILFLLVRYSRRNSYGKRMRVSAHILGALYSLMTAFGYHLERAGTVPYTDVMLIFSITMYAHVYALLLCGVWSFLEKKECEYLQTQFAEDGGNFVVQLLHWILKRPVLLAGTLFLCWMPCYLSTFPGNFYYDANAEFMQSVKGYDGSFPMLHSVLVIGVMRLLYRVTASYNTGIAVLTVLQMLLLSSMFTHMLRVLYRRKKNVLLLGAALLYTALFPLVHVLAATPVRDVLFSGMLVFVVVECYDLCQDPKLFFADKKRSLLFGISITLTIFARLNAMGIGYGLLLLTVAVGVYFAFGRCSRGGRAVFGISLVGSFLVTALSLTAICAPIRPADFGGSMSVLSQSLARAYFYEGDDWTEDQKNRFSEFFNMEGLEYVSENADPTKGQLWVDENTLMPFLKFWAAMGTRYPQCYLDAFLAGTRHMWFPSSVIDAYVEAGAWDTEKSLYFFVELEPPADRVDLLPQVHNFYEQLGLSITYEKIPVLSMMFSIGFHFWMLLNCLFYAISCRCRNIYLPLGILLGYTVISAFAPLVYLRYYSALFLAFPLVLVLTLQPSK